MPKSKMPIAKKVKTYESNKPMDHSCKDSCAKHPKISAKKVTVAKGVKVPKETIVKVRKKAGSSNAGKYENVSPKNFAGEKGGASRYSYPIDTLERAKAALKLAHNAPNPAGIRRVVYDKYPQLKPS